MSVSRLDMESMLILIHTWQILDRSFQAHRGSQGIRGFDREGLCWSFGDFW